MRGRSTNFEYLGTEILKTLGESDRPISALGVNFAINDKLDRIIELNIIRNHLNALVKNKKVLKKVNADTTYYKINKRK